MKKQTKLFVTIILAALILIAPALPAKAMGLTTTQLTLVKGQTYQLPNAYWYCKYLTTDSKVVEVSESGMLTARRVGSSEVRQSTLQGTINYKVTVVDTVDIVVMMGQSNMCGSGGLATQCPEVDSKALQFYNGKLSNLSRQGSLIPAFANAYVKGTKTPVVTIQTAIGGTTSNGWVTRSYTTDAAKQLKSCISYLKKKNVTIGHVYCLWLQGESDAIAGVLKEQYVANVRTIAGRMRKAGSEKFLIIQVGSFRDNTHPVDEEVAGQKELCKKYSSQFAMVTNITAKLSKSKANYSDTVHFNQKALNKIGAAAGKGAAKLAKSGKK